MLQRVPQDHARFSQEPSPFFYDIETYMYLKQEILPRMVAQARERDQVLRIWSAGCATGEGAYGLAILLTDLLGEEFSAWRITIFATDIDETAITIARRGVYAGQFLQNIPPEHHNRFFEPVPQGYRIVKRLRNLINFGYHDLRRQPPFPHLDLIVCRKLLPAFTSASQANVLDRFAFSLSPGGYLLLDRTETLQLNPSYYEYINSDLRVFHRTRTSVPIVSLRGSLSLVPLHMAQMEKTQPRNQDPSLLPLPRGHLQSNNDTLLNCLPIGVMVIDRTYRLRTWNRAAQQFLVFQEQATQQDFLHALPGLPYARVRRAIDTVFRRRTTITLADVELADGAGGNGHSLCLSISPIQGDTDSSDLAVISVSNVTEQVQTRQELATTQAQHIQSQKELEALEMMNTNLLNTNE